MANKLRDLLEYAAGRGGIAHQIAIQDLRDYLQMQNLDRIVREMQDITQVELLKYMQEAGLTGALYREYIAHLKTLPQEEE